MVEHTVRLAVPRLLLAMPNVHKRFQGCDLPTAGGTTTVRPSALHRSPPPTAEFCRNDKAPGVTYVVKLQNSFMGSFELAL